MTKGAIRTTSRIRRQSTRSHRSVGSNRTPTFTHCDAVNVRIQADEQLLRNAHAAIRLDRASGRAAGVRRAVHGQRAGQRLAAACGNVARQKQVARTCRARSTDVVSVVGEQQVAGDGRIDSQRVCCAVAHGHVAVQVYTTSQGQRAANGQVAANGRSASQEQVTRTRCARSTDVVSVVGKDQIAADRARHSDDVSSCVTQSNSPIQGGRARCVERGELTRGRGCRANGHVVDRATAEVDKVKHLDDVRTIHIQVGFAAVWYSDTSASRGLDRDALATGRVVLDDVLFLAGRNHQLASGCQATKCRGHIQHQGTRRLGRIAVGDADGQVGIRHIVNIAVTNNGLLKRSAQVGVCDVTPSARVFPGGHQLNLEVGGVGASCHVISFTLGPGSKSLCFRH